MLPIFSTLWLNCFLWFIVGFPFCQWIRIKSLICDAAVPAFLTIVKIYYFHKFIIVESFLHNLCWYIKCELILLISKSACAGTKRPPLLNQVAEYCLGRILHSPLGLVGLAFMSPWDRKTIIQGAKYAPLISQTKCAVWVF